MAKMVQGKIGENLMTTTRLGALHAMQVSMKHLEPILTVKLIASLDTECTDSLNFLVSDHEIILANTYPSMTDMAGHYRRLEETTEHPCAPWTDLDVVVIDHLDTCEACKKVKLVFVTKLRESPSEAVQKMGWTMDMHSFDHSAQARLRLQPCLTGSLVLGNLHGTGRDMHAVKQQARERAGCCLGNARIQVDVLVRRHTCGLTLGADWNGNIESCDVGIQWVSIQGRPQLDATGEHFLCGLASRCRSIRRDHNASTSCKETKNRSFRKFSF